MRLIGLVVVGFCVSTASAMFMLPSDAPVDRLVKNASAYIKKNPKDASGYYVLGRIHYLAWSIKTGSVPVWGNPEAGGKPEVVPNEHLGDAIYRARQAEADQRVKKAMNIADTRHIDDKTRQAYWKATAEEYKKLEQTNWRPSEIAPAKLAQHAAEAMTNFDKAIKLAPRVALHWLGRASLQAERADELAAKAEKQPDDKAAQTIAAMRKAAIDDFAKAFDLSVAKDARLRMRPLAGVRSLVSHEAAQGYLRLVTLLPDERRDERIAKRMTVHLAKMNDLPIGAITPIVFSFKPHSSLGDLVDAGASVAFDLDGTARPRKWQWVKPDTALLVWDPHRTGRITSGRQLFGSVTWWLMPGDGYRALDLLDDDRNGELAGNELAGLAAWFDRNGDGVSDEGEVTPLEALPIAGISVQPLSRDGDALCHPFGLRLLDGSTRPTYDWIAEPAK